MKKIELLLMIIIFLLHQTLNFSFAGKQDNKYHKLEGNVEAYEPPKGMCF